MVKTEKQWQGRLTGRWGWTCASHNVTQGMRQRVRMYGVWKPKRVQLRYDSWKFDWRRTAVRLRQTNNGMGSYQHACADSDVSCSLLDGTSPGATAAVQSPSGRAACRLLVVGQDGKTHPVLGSQGVGCCAFVLEQMPMQRQACPQPSCKRGRRTTWIGGISRYLF